MGCANSRLDDLPAVALCRDRCKAIDEALRTNHSFAEAHSAYTDSLKSLAPILSAFFATARKPPLSATAPNQSNSDSDDAHLRFPSDSEDDGEEEKDDKSGHGLGDDETRLLIASNFGFSNSVGGGGGGVVSSPPQVPPPAADSFGSAWDFLNFFETFEKYERLYSETNSERVKADREEKIAPEENEVRGVEKKSGDDGGGAKTMKKKEMRVKASRDSSESGVIAPNVSEAMNEVQSLFFRASESGNGVLELLSTCQKLTVNQDSFGLCLEESFVLNSPNLSSSLKKLLLWEKKLYCEIKAEEKLRLIYQKRLQELKYLDNEVAKAQKANTTRALLRDLTTKLKIAFQIVDRISMAINKLRDEELWPQIKELNLRLLPMWKTMLESHKSQYQKVAEAKGFDAISSMEKLHTEDVKAAIWLKLELQTWNLSFSNWVFAQKAFAKSLNGWLTRCLCYEPEETPDGLIPFSPGRVGAPPIFVMCNDWSQAIDKLSEKEVIAAIQGFIARIDALLKEHNVDVQQILVSDKEIMKKVKILERQEQKIHKVNDSEVALCTDFQQGMLQIFVAVEKFMANSIQVYGEISLRIDEFGEKATDQSLPDSA